MFRPQWWARSTLRRRRHDISTFAISRPGALRPKSDGPLRHWSKNGYKAICAPARPTDRAKLLEARLR
eukprot:202607-Pyramimonas_sp.AAC.1